MNNLKKRIEESVKVSEQFDLYLEKSNLEQSKMSDIQYMETRRAFYAGFGQMVILFISKIGDAPEDEGVRIIDDILQEVQEFYAKEINL